MFHMCVIDCVVQKADVEVFFDEVERPPNLPRANMPGAAPGAQKAAGVGGGPAAAATAAGGNTAGANAGVRQ